MPRIFCKGQNFSSTLRARAQRVVVSVVSSEASREKVVLRQSFCFSSHVSDQLGSVLTDNSCSPSATHGSMLTPQ